MSEILCSSCGEKRRVGAHPLHPSKVCDFRDIPPASDDVISLSITPNPSPFEADFC